VNGERSTLVFHPFDDSFCSNLPGDPRPWVNCQQPEHGTIVTCSLCGKIGVEPDSDHVADFLPEWMKQR